MIDIKIGDEVELVKYLVNYDQIAFRVTVYHVQNDEIIVSQPIANGTYYPISKGNFCDIRYIRVNQGMYVFQAKVVERTLVDGLFALKLEKISEVKKVQRRHFFRVPVSERGEIQFEDERYRFFTKDISGGGMLITTEGDFEVGTDVNGLVTLEGHEIQFHSRVVRNIRAEDKHAIGLFFTKLSSGDESKIVSFCFDRQRKLKNK